MERWQLMAWAWLCAACQESAPTKKSAASHTSTTHQVSQADYDDFRRPEKLIAALGLRPGDIVADVGAGRGYLTGLLAHAVGEGGYVVATDIDEKALAFIAPAKVGDAVIEPRRVSAEDPGLEAARYHLILLAEVDHLLVDPVAYFRRLRPALAPGGRIAVANRLQRRERCMATLAKAGYHIVSEYSDLPGQFLVLVVPSSDSP